MNSESDTVYIKCEEDELLNRSHETDDDGPLSKRIKLETDVTPEAEFYSPMAVVNEHHDDKQGINEILKQSVMGSVMKSERGNDMLADELNFMYHKNGMSKSGTLIYWGCIERKSKNCKARLHTKTSADNYEIEKHVNEHTHSAGKDIIDAKTARNILKCRATTSHLSTQALVSEVTASLDEATVSQMPALQTLSRAVRNWRQKETNFPPLPSRRTGYTIPAEFSLLESGETFLQYDSGTDDPNRMLIFASDSGIQDLKRYRNWAVDGTFKVAPDIYYQLFTIHVRQGTFSAPRVFALLPNKTEETYRLVFNEIKALVGAATNLETVTTDFERATLNPLTDLFPSTSLNGSLFHFSQCLYRKIGDLGYKVQYHNDTTFSLKMRHFTALAFVPCSDVIEVYEQLSDDEMVPQEFLEYFEPMYIGMLRGPRNNRWRAAPRFSIALWNVYDRVEDSLPRTNDNVEGLHQALSKSITNSHLNIWKLITALKKEESVAAAKRVQFERGDPFPTVKKCNDRNVRIKNIVARYADTENKMDYLKFIALDMHLF